MKDNLLRISEFARLCGCSAETLRYYDRENLLNPIYIDESNGYRYYDIGQYRCYKVIAELKEQNFSIVQTKDLFCSITNETAVHMLEENLAQVNHEIEQLQRKKENLLKKLEYCRGEEAACCVRRTECEIRQFAPMTIFVAAEAKKSHGEKELYEQIALYERIRKDLALQDSAFSDELYCCWIDAALDVKCLGMILQKGHSVEGVDGYVVEQQGGLYASLRFKGRFFSYRRYLSLLSNYIVENGYEAIGDAMIVAMGGHVLVSPCINMFYSIRIPVRLVEDRV